MKTTQQRHMKLIPGVQLRETLFFLLLMRHTLHPTLLSKVKMFGVLRYLLLRFKLFAVDYLNVIFLLILIL